MKLSCGMNLIALAIILTLVVGIVDVFVYVGKEGILVYIADVRPC